MSKLKQIPHYTFAELKEYFEEVDFDTCGGGLFYIMNISGTKKFLIEKIEHWVKEQNLEKAQYFKDRLIELKELLDRAVWHNLTEEQWNIERKTYFAD